MMKVSDIGSDGVADSPSDGAQDAAIATMINRPPRVTTDTAIPSHGRVCAYGIVPRHPQEWVSICRECMVGRIWSGCEVLRE